MPEPMPAEPRSVQPGGGVCYRIELAWGRLRRWLLTRFRPGYVARMARLRRGSCDGAPHAILDPRDLKYCRNQCTCHWLAEDDPFAWRDRLPFARWGLGELVLMGVPLALVTALVAAFAWHWAWIPAIPLVWVMSFFRDPPRRIPQEPGLLVSPADGKVVEISRVEHDAFIGGPAVRIGIFLSIFNVHLNRAPAACRVIALRYQPGEFLNAMNPASAIRNENIWIALEEESPPHRRLIVRPIAGAIARRIVCPLRTGDRLARGEKIGMIKLGSRTELILPESEELVIETQVGRRVKAGSSVLARWTAPAEPVGSSNQERGQ
ncbi:MAG: phosphatidylserine decarboxylase family protein [Pirellulales bacterium]|nr:phosphatidylserine decarboxylase family protein [Pirellulales bacterium]